MTITYRQAVKSDCAALAELDSLAAGGFVEHLYHDLIPGLTPVEAVALAMEQDVYPHTYKSAVVAEANQEVVGMALSYPSKYHGITGEMRAFFPADRLDPYEEFFNAPVEESWFVDALAVGEPWQRRGIGRRLVELTRDAAAHNGFRALTLIAFADNDRGLAFYRNFGFETVRHLEFPRSEYVRHEGGALLLRYRFS